MMEISMQIIKRRKYSKEEMLTGMRKRENNPELYEDEESFVKAKFS